MENKSHIIIEKKKDEQIVHVTLNLPEKKNILTAQMISELTQAFSNFAKNENIKVIILSGNGSHFCAGGDLTWMKLKPDTSDNENIQEVQLLFKMFEVMRACPIPIVGKVYGSAFGGGLGLISVCDIVLAQSDSQFCFSELKLNLIPAVIAPFVLRKVPLSFVKELILSARTFSTEEALKIGLIHFVGTSEECEYYWTNLESHFLRCDPAALKQSKRLLNNISQWSNEDIQENCTRALAERRKSPKAIEQISRFLDKKI